jgi:hypothetical protein
MFSAHNITATYNMLLSEHTAADRQITGHADTDRQITVYYALSVRTKLL